jgi:hypothetical protein
MRRRLDVLERLPQLPHPPNSLEQISSLALKQRSDADWAVMMKIAGDVEAGGRRTLLQSESAALAALKAVQKMEARRMGFRSFERIAGQTR